MSSNRDIFNLTMEKIIDAGMKGYDGSFFCYGQTGSGKTYTMYGNDKNPGIALRSLDYLFNCNGIEQIYKVTLGFLEIYNETINDLLNPDRKNLQLIEVAKGVVNVKGLTECICKTLEDAYEVLKLGERNKHIGITKINDKSSRSHTMYALFKE